MTWPNSALHICVVCAGNICRSPIAEFVLRRQLTAAGLDDHVTVDSAGTGGWHSGEPADHRALAVLHRHGYDGAAHRARQFRREWFDTVDLVVAMDHDNLAHLHKLAPDDDARSKVRLLRTYDPDALTDGDTDVPDPYYGDIRSFEDVLTMVEKATQGLVGMLRDEVTITPRHGGEHRRH